MSALLGLIGGLGLLLYGLKIVSEALQVLFGDRLRGRMSTVGATRRAQVATGAVASLIVQSSAAAAVMIVSFVNAGLLDLGAAAGVLVGANLGATATAWLLALRLGRAGLALLGVGAIVHLLATRERLRFAGALTMGAGMLFIAVRWLEHACTTLPAWDYPLWLLQPLDRGAVAVLGAVLFAAAATALLQSATAMVGITIALAGTGLLRLDGALALVIGANLGSTVSAHRAALPATADSRRAALLHTLFNASTGVVLLAGFDLWLRVVAALGLRQLGADGQPPIATPVQVALAHTTFNLLLAVVSLPLLTLLVRLAHRLIGKSLRERAGLRYLRPSMVEAPALAIEQCRLEVLHMAGLADAALQLTRDLLADLHTESRELRRQILEREKATDTAQHEVTVFLARVMAGTLSVAQGAECRALVRAADEIESVADYCERLANYRRRLVREGVVIDSDALRDLQGYLDRTIALFEDIVDRIRRRDSGWLDAITTKAEYLATEADALRDANLQRLAAQRISPTAGIFFNDMLVAVRRIRNHALNLAEAFVEL
ncbi:MAG: Na/Pi symporter [Deltaproteobacteria bacterium]|nr:Na/Pi symporter [Deltaproteobacteria bacterium]